MRKIYPALSQYRRNNDGVASRWITTQNPELMAEFGYEVRHLYSQAAMIVAMEAMRDACQAEVKRAFGLDESFEAIDTAAIINQLTGE